MKLKLIIRLLLLVSITIPILLPFRQTDAQSGVLVPSSVKDESDESLLSLQLMNVDILIDNQHAKVSVVQIFNSHSPMTLEGKYSFALPLRGAVSDFAVWDGDTRIPGVIMEKRRANEIYTQLKQPQVDPGLLQQDDDHGGASAFSAKIFPIPAYGSKRLELEYTEILPIEDLNSHFVFPLKPSSYGSQKIGELNIRLRLLSDYPISEPRLSSNSYQMNVIKNEPNTFESEFHSTNVELKEDLIFNYKINVPESAISWTTFRAPEHISVYDLKDPAQVHQNPDGYFQAQAIFNQQAKSSDQRNKRNLILVLDTSLSMFGEKLIRAFESIEHFLHGLTAEDQFNLILFNSDVTILSETPLPATTENIERSLNLIKNSTLAGGTNLNKALIKSTELAQRLPVGERNIVLISDANPTLGTTKTKQLSKLFEEHLKDNIKLFALALGSDANQSLLKELTKKCNGYFVQARETEDITVQLKLFFSKLGSQGINDLRFSTNDSSNMYHIYSSNSSGVFDRSSCSYVGRYKNPQPQTTVSIQGQYGAETVTLSRTVSLPESDNVHGHLPRIWARARIDALIDEMNINGEREDYIQEVIRLSRRYKLVTPYTAFLAAPRSLLRPRLIQPGDPVIRVKTDPLIKSVFAVLPFGETLPLNFIETENVWETRFLAPSWMPDGTYKCRLLLTDKDGNGYQEDKSFVIDSHPPRLRASISNTLAKAGDEITIKVASDSDTSRIVARMYGTQPVQLFWSEKEKANIGKLIIPTGLAAGRYQINISAEDFAHNQSTVELNINVL